MDKPTKRAAAFLRSGKIFLHPYLHTTDGLWIFSTPVIVIGEGEEGSIGRQVLSALSESKHNVPHPSSRKGATDPLLRAGGVRSFNAFAKSAKYVEIFLDDKGIGFTPTKNGGPQNGFLHLGDKTVRSEPSEENIAAALRAGFIACE